jgi:hypothetical protein
METFDDDPKSLSIEVEAGPQGEGGKPYAWIDSPLPKWLKSVDDPHYQRLSSVALTFAKTLANKMGERIRLTLKVRSMEDPRTFREISFEKKNDPTSQTDENANN